MSPNDNRTPHLSEDYDAQVRISIPYYDAIHRETVELIKCMPEHPKLWLDTGCGTGSMVRSAMDAFTSTRFIMTDPSRSMLDQARGKLVGAAERVRIIGPVTTQELGSAIDDRPDVITAIQCHHYLSPDDRKRAITACFDLLTERGIFVTFENIRPFTEAGIDIGKKYWGNFQAGLGRKRSEIEAHLRRFGSEYFPITVEEHLELLRGTGFRTVEIFWYSYMQAGFYCLK